MMSKIYLVLSLNNDDTPLTLTCISDDSYHCCKIEIVEKFSHVHRTVKVSRRETLRRKFIVTSEQRDWFQSGRILEMIGNVCLFNRV